MNAGTGLVAFQVGFSRDLAKVFATIPVAVAGRLDANEAFKRRMEGEDLKAEQQKETRQERKHVCDRESLLGALSMFRQGETSRVVREAAGHSGAKFNDLIEDLRYSAQKRHK